jgi:hypothetical protein
MHLVSNLRVRAQLLDQNHPYLHGMNILMTLDNLQSIAQPRAGDVSIKCLPYQLDGRLVAYHGCNG